MKLILLNYLNTKKRKFRNSLKQSIHQIEDKMTKSLLNKILDYEKEASINEIEYINSLENKKRKIKYPRNR